jgi:hypothetical protein
MCFAYRYPRDAMMLRAPETEERWKPLIPQGSKTCRLRNTAILNQRRSATINDHRETSGYERGIVDV